MQLPNDFVRRISATFAPAGAPWLAALPTLIEHFAARWQLQVLPPFPALSYNYVAPAQRADGTEVVLKLGVPCAELSSEIAALRHYAGRGACRLLDADEAAGALLLEYVRPGANLVQLATDDDEAATSVAAAVMARLWAPPPPGHTFRDLVSWTGEIHSLRPHFAGGSGPFPADLVDQALSLFAELCASQQQVVLLHGDLHHFNILRSGDAWLAIDPKGIVGDPAFDCAALLFNPWPTIAVHPQLAHMLERRIAILAAHLALDPRRILGWAQAQALLSAWWSYEDDVGEQLEVSVALTIARALATLRHAADGGTIPPNAR